MNIFDLQAGADFINIMNAQFPRLVDAVEKLAVVASDRPTLPELPVYPREGLLRDFYRGYYQPGETAGGTQSQVYKKDSEELRTLETDIRARISNEDWALVEQYCDVLMRRGGEELSIVFEAGYRAATQLLLAGLTAPREVHQNEV